MFNLPIHSPQNKTKIISKLHHPSSCAVERLGKSQDPQQTQQTHPGI